MIATASTPTPPELPSFVTVIGMSSVKLSLVPESVTADIVGHEKKTMTYGLYSGGSSLKQKLEAINKIKYS